MEFDEFGYDEYGYDWDGYDKDGYDRQGYNRNNEDREGNKKFFNGMTLSVEQYKLLQKIPMRVVTKGGGPLDMLDPVTNIYCAEGTIAIKDGKIYIVKEVNGHLMFGEIKDDGSISEPNIRASITTFSILADETEEMEHLTEGDISHLASGKNNVKTLVDICRVSHIQLCDMLEKLDIPVRKINEYTIVANDDEIIRLDSNKYDVQHIFEGINYDRSKPSYEIPIYRKNNYLYETELKEKGATFISDAKNGKIIIGDDIVMVDPDVLPSDDYYKKYMQRCIEDVQHRKARENKSHDISEITATVSDRKLEDINKVVSEISEEMKDKSKENEPTKGN